MKLPHLNGNKDHFLLSSIMVYTFIGIPFPYSSIHCGGPAAHMYQVYVWDTPPEGGDSPPLHPQFSAWRWNASTTSTKLPPHHLHLHNVHVLCTVSHATNCEFFNFSGSFFGEQVNLKNENRFVPLTKEKRDRSSPCGTNKSSFISGLKFISMNINSIRGKKLDLLAFLDFHQPHVVAIQETKIDSSNATSELFPETCPYSVYRKDRNIHGGGVMLLVHKDISVG